MLKNYIYSFLEKRHFWRYASFSEIAELYTSRTLRIVALNLASGFASVYLYQEGFSLVQIMAYWVFFFLFKIPLTLGWTYFIARFGPKHGILLSNILYIPAMVSLGLLPQFGFAAVIIWGLFMSSSASLYQLCYLIDFSKVKNIQHAGSEIAFMNILEKIAVGVSPIVGGLVALFFGPPYVMWAAAVFFMIAAIPMLFTDEAVRTKQIIDWKGFPWRTLPTTITSQIGMGVDVVTTGHAWGLFIAIVIFPNAGNGVYVTLGTLSSVTILVAVFTSYAYGKLIDRRRGGTLLKFSVIANALVHISRAFATGPAAIVTANVTNEMATAGYNMAYMRGMFDTADISGHRIVYLSITQIIANFGAAIGAGVLTICAALIGNADGLRVYFFIAAGFVLLIGTARFRLYQR